MSNALLTLSGVTKDFGGLRAVSNVNLQVKQGSITALIGPNGAGKTTVINIISGAYRCTEGNIFLGDRPLDGLSMQAIAGIGIARTFQLTKVFADMTVLENVMVGTHRWATKSNFLRTILNRPSVRREERFVHEYAMETLSLLGIAGLAGQRAGNLPHGLQRLLELARAIATKPELILLDEPAAGLNPHEEDMLQGILKAIVETGISILLVEHHMRLVMSVSDWVHVLDVGCKIAEGTPEEIGRNPVVVKAYLGKEY
jgi:branched-chain amino acid transport system ATP-binding protein